MLIQSKLVSDINKVDKRVKNLLKGMISAFSYAQEASQTGESIVSFSFLQGFIKQLLDQLIECSLFVREYYLQKLFSMYLLNSICLE